MSLRVTTAEEKRVLLEGAGKEKESRGLPGDWDPKFFLVTGIQTQCRDEVFRKEWGFVCCGEWFGVPPQKNRKGPDRTRSTFHGQMWEAAGRGTEVGPDDVEKREQCNGGFMAVSNGCKGEMQ